MEINDIMNNVHFTSSVINVYLSLFLIFCVLFSSKLKIGKRVLILLVLTLVFHLSFVFSLINLEKNKKEFKESIEEKIKCVVVSEIDPITFKNFIYGYESIKISINKDGEIIDLNLINRKGRVDFYKYWGNEIYLKSYI